MAYRSQADWSLVDWSYSDREIASLLGVSHGAVAKRRKQLGHSSDYKVDTALLRGWFECNRARLSLMSNYDIRVEVFAELDLMGFDVAYWRRQMNPEAHAEKALRESAANVP